MKTKWIYLSWELSPELSNYGGASGIQIDWVRSMQRGDTSNNSALSLPAHTGTHIDYPLHFVAGGRSGSSYSAADLTMQRPEWIDISSISPADFLIRPEHLVFPDTFNFLADFLILKTGFCNKRSEEVYWKENWGFAPETASYLKKQFPLLKGIGFDLISLSSYQQREIGRVAHKSFLQEQELLIVEDMDLREVQEGNRILQCILAPLRFKGADGAPLTITAQIA